jgi:site-specific recombinase XerD
MIAMNQELITISDQELIDRLQEYGTDAEGAFAENTMMALRRDLEKFATWCKKQNRSALLDRYSWYLCEDESGG